jgi:cytochrome c556
MGNHPPGAPSPGAFMPPEFRMMGRTMHEAADEVAKAASAVSNPPTAQDWKAVMGAVSALTAACAGCHGSFRLK